MLEPSGKETGGNNISTLTNSANVTIGDWEFDWSSGTVVVKHSGEPVSKESVSDALSKYDTYQKIKPYTIYIICGIAFYFLFMRK
jgi:hypothetical protein